MVSISGVSVQTYYSIQHVRAAAFFAREMRALETRLHGTVWREADNVAGLGYVAATLFSAVGFLEALVNEIYADSLTQDGHHLKHLGPEALKRVAAGAVDRDIQRSPVTDKFKDLLLAAGKKPLLKGSRVSQDAQLVIDLRNELTHYKAAFFDMGSPGMNRKGAFVDGKLKRAIQTKFAPRDGSTNQANSWMGAGCASWSVGAVISYAEATSAALDMRPLHAHVREALIID